MPLRGKFKSFWNDGPRWLVWLKRVACVLVAWPVLTTLIYSFMPVPVSNLMLLHLPRGDGIHKTWVPLSAISVHLPRAVLAAEDQRFCQHHGIDWTELRDAFDNEDGPSRGASTIPMQVAKNLYLWEGRSALRKGLELPLAAYMNLVLSKRRMLEIYLNIAEWGPGIYGAEAAAQYHFEKPASRLTASEAALLAASLPNPIKREAGEPSARLRGLAAHIQSQMAGMDEYLACLGQNPPL
jgi:monofunctional glycosyltransferase